MTNGKAESWHLDKKVPVAFIAFFIIQTLTLVYIGTAWKTEIDGRVAALEKTDFGQQSYENRITVLEQKFNYIQQSLERIEKNIDRIAP